MEHDEQASTLKELSTTLILTVGIALTVLLALFFSLTDALQVRLPEPLETAVLAENGGVERPTTMLNTSTPVPTRPPTAVALTPTPTSSSIIAEASCPPPTDWAAYTVQADDTLMSLSLAAGVSTQAIMQANCLGVFTLRPGQTIYLPLIPPEQPDCGPPASWVRYIVQPGDTIFALANQRGTTVLAIMQANCLVNTRIFAGRALYLPPGGPPPPTSPPPPSATIRPTVTTIPSATATEIATGTATATATATVSATATSTPTSTGTATATATAVVTSTMTITPSSTPLPTTTSTPSPTGTAITPSATPTVSPTATATTSPSPTPSATVVASPTPTTAPTATIAPTSTATSSAR